eukprot:9451362-Alexandrium_andersonii.AAC.1
MSFSLRQTNSALEVAQPHRGPLSIPRTRLCTPHGASQPSARVGRGLEPKQQRVCRGRSMARAPRGLANAARHA